MRFTIRDLMWLMAVVGLGIAMAIAIRDRKAVRDELESAESQIQSSNETIEVMTSELERISGKEYRGHSTWSDPSTKERRYKIYYEGEPSPKSIEITPPNDSSPLTREPN